MSRACDVRSNLFPLLIVLSLVATPVLADDFRTWSDTSGQFEIKAKFIAEKNGTVTLQQEDGEELEIPLEKLSKADQDAVAEAKKKAASNPFKAKSANPFKSKDKASMPSKESSSNKESSSSNGEPRTITVNWANAETVPFMSPNDGWKVQVPEGLDKDTSKTKPVALPAKKDFWEGLKTIAVSPDGKKAVAGYLHENPKPTGTPRLVICDLETGKSTNPASSSGMMVPLSLHNDGKHVLLRSDIFGFGNNDRLEIWNVTGSKIDKIASWVPYESANGGDRDIKWGSFIGTDKFATYGNKELAVWSFPAIEPLFRVPVDGDGRPAISPDGKHIAICDGKALALLNVDSQEIVASQSLPTGHYPWPHLAFSPSGERLACVAANHLIVWEVPGGEILEDVTDVGLPANSPPLFPHEEYVLIGGKFLYGIENRVKLWTYEGAEQYAMAGPNVVYAVTDGQKPGMLMAGKLPHPAALDLLKKALTDANLFILKAGTKVKLDVDGITDASKRDAALKGLTARVKAIGCEVDPKGTITLSASTETGKEEKTIHFRSAGDYKTREYITRVKFVYDGKTVWEQVASNVPHMMFVMLENGENIDTYLKKREKPDYALFEKIELPRFLQKPSNGNGPNNSLTLGTSRVTTSGVR